MFLWAKEKSIIALNDLPCGKICCGVQTKKFHVNFLHTGPLGRCGLYIGGVSGCHQLVIHGILQSVIIHSILASDWFGGAGAYHKFL